MHSVETPPVVSDASVVPSLDAALVLSPAVPSLSPASLDDPEEMPEVDPSPSLEPGAVASELDSSTPLVLTVETEPPSLALVVVVPPSVADAPVVVPVSAPNTGFSSEHAHSPRTNAETAGIFMRSG
jgi:hypothetical protein